MVAAYCRCSTTKQEREGHTIEAQSSRILSCYPDAQVYTDPGVSASIPFPERPSGAALTKAMVQGGVTKVVITRLDRAFRSVVDALTTIDDWTKRGIEIVVLDLSGMQVDSATPMGRVFLTIISAFAEFERSMVSERTKAVLKHLQEQGKYIGTGKRYTDDNSDRLTARKFRSQGMTYEQVAFALTQRGSQSSFKKPWTSERVRWMLRGMK